MKYFVFHYDELEGDDIFDTLKEAVERANSFPNPVDNVRIIYGHEVKFIVDDTNQ